MADQIDVVNKPTHYNTGTIECIDAMKAMADGSGVSEHPAYLWQNAFKYLWRWPYKQKPIEDLQKCAWYLERLISELKSEQEKKEQYAEEQ